MSKPISDMSLQEKAEIFPIKEARAIAKRFTTPNPWIYWADYTASAVIAWTSFIYAVLAEPFAIDQIVAIVVAAFAFLRALIFIHELAHLRAGTFKWFSLFWNFTCGFAMMVPRYAYTGVHTDHHKPQFYGTSNDGEYLPLGAGSPWRIPLYVLEGVYLPLLLILRFLVVTPVSYIFPPLRKIVWERMSSLVIDMNYIRPAASKRDGVDWKLQEFFTVVYVVAAAALIALGYLPLATFFVWYAVVFLALVVNAIRTLGAHAYRNPGDRPMNKVEEFLDSVDVPGTFLTALWAPVGLRFHATHHLFPGMPYHELGKCYKAMLEELPEPELYLSSTRKSLPHAIKCLWRDASAAEAAKASTATGNAPK